LLGAVGMTMTGLLIILIVWQAVAPIQFVISTSKRDVYGFPLYSSAMCVVNSDATLIFLATAITYICIVLLVTMWVSFWVRNAPEKFQEARMTAVAGMSMFQVFFVAIPTAAAVWNSALPRFFVLSSLTFLLCIILLFTMFLPKIFRKQFGVDRSSEIQDRENLLAQRRGDATRTPSMTYSGPRVQRSFVERVLESVPEEGEDELEIEDKVEGIDGGIDGGIYKVSPMQQNGVVDPAIRVSNGAGKNGSHQSHHSSHHST